MLTPLRCVFEDALNGELTEFNPFNRIALGKLLRQTTRSSDYEVDPFTAAERERLLEHARADERPMLQFWFNTGLRPGELIAIKWPKVDWIGTKTRIDLNYVTRTEKAPKTAAGVRDVDLNSEAMAALIAQKPISFQAGGNPWYVAQQLGHVDVQLVFRVYGKFIPADYSARRPSQWGRRHVRIHV